MVLLRGVLADIFFIGPRIWSALATYPRERTRRGFVRVQRASLQAVGSPEIAYPDFFFHEEI